MYSSRHSRRYNVFYRGAEKERSRGCAGVDEAGVGACRKPPSLTDAHSRSLPSLQGSRRLLTRRFRNGGLPRRQPQEASATVAFSKAFAVEFRRKSPCWKESPVGRFTRGSVLSVLAAVVMYLLLWRSRLGVRIRAVGLSPRTARYARMRIGTNTVLAGFGGPPSLQPL